MFLGLELYNVHNSFLENHQNGAQTITDIVLERQQPEFKSINELVCFEMLQLFLWAGLPS